MSMEIEPIAVKIPKVNVINKGFALIFIEILGS